MMTGSCLCGGVRFEIAGLIRSPRFCHCSNCRKFSGAPYAAWGLAQTSDVKVTGEAGVTKYDSGAGLRAFCSSCGSPVWYEPSGLPQYRGIPLGILDGDDIPAPQMHVWMQSKIPWVVIGDQLPQHSRHP